MLTHSKAYNNEPMALFLIDHGADVNTPATDGTTPLHIAAGVVARIYYCANYIQIVETRQ